MNQPTTLFAGAQFGSSPPFVHNGVGYVDPSLLELPLPDIDAGSQLTGRPPLDAYQAYALDPLLSAPDQLQNPTTAHDHVLNPQAPPFSPHPSPSSSWGPRSSASLLDPQAPPFLSQHDCTIVNQPPTEHNHAPDPAGSTFGYDLPHENNHGLGDLPNLQPIAQFLADVAHLPNPTEPFHRPFVPVGQLLLTPSNMPSPDVASWTMGQYNPGAPYPQSQPPPLTPTTTLGPNSRRSIAPSTTAATSIVCSCHGKEFSKRHQYNKHMSWQGARPHVCNICANASITTDFVKNTDLLRHITTQHNAERPFLCNHVGCKYHTRGFNRPDALTRHIKTRHPGDPLPPSSTRSGRSRQSN